MSLARHRLTRRRQAEVNKPDDGGDGGTEVIGDVKLYPNEDTYIRDVKIVGGATGSTSTTYFRDFHLHHTALGASSDAILQLGAAARFFIQEEVWGQYEFTPAYELATPAARMLWYTNVSDWGPPGNPFDPSEPGGDSGTYGITGGDEILSATLSLKIYKIWGHHVPMYDQGATYAVADRNYCIYRGTRNQDVEGASNGWTAGSMDTMGWYHFKGAPTADAYWGSSGGDSLANTNTSDIIRGQVLGTCFLGPKPSEGNELPNQGGNPGDGSTFGPPDDGTTRPDGGVTLDDGGGYTIQPLFGQQLAIGSERAMPFGGGPGGLPSSTEVQIDVTPFVQDCIDSRTGDLRLVFIGENDTNTEFNGPTSGIPGGYYTYWRHMMEIYSVNHPQVELRPCIDVRYKRTVPRS